MSAALRFYDVPWNDVSPVPHDCLCSVDETARLPFTYVSTSNVVELRFDVIGMNSTDDFTTLFFEGTWKFIRTPACKMKLRLQGPSGEIVFQHPPPTPQEVRIYTTWETRKQLRQTNLYKTISTSFSCFSSLL